MLTDTTHSDRHLEIERGCFMAARDIGHVRWFKPRKRWYIDLHYDGRRHHIYSFQGVSFKQKDYAEDVLTLIRGEIATGTFDIRKYKKGLQLTVKVYAEKWVETLDLAPTTITDYEVSIRRYIGPFFENTDIRDVRHHHLMEFKSWMAKRRAPKGVYNVMGCLKTVLKYAWRNGDIKTVPPFPSVEYTRPAIKWIDKTTQAQIIEAIPQADRYIFWFMAIYGTRPGEARALQKSDIQDKNIIIRHSFSINKLRKTTKTHRIRILPRTAEFDELFEQIPRRVTSFVFTRSKDGKPYTQKDLGHLWNAACKQIGIEINLYNGLKHSLGMNLLDQGVSKEMVQQIYGHTSPDTTNRYCEYQTRHMKIALEGGTLISLKDAKKK
jgi:integrase